MNIRRLVFVFILAAAQAVIAQGPPAAGGPPSTAALKLVDQNGVVVGDLVGDVERPALVKYKLAGGDIVLLDASPVALLRPTPLMFLGSADCTGNEAYAFPGTASQLTKRQAAVIVLGTDAQGFPVSTRLYVSDPYIPAIPLPAGTVTSRSNGTGCVTGPFPTPLDAGNYVKFTYVEDLSTKFTPPFWVP